MKNLYKRFCVFFQYRELFYQLVSRDIKLKYRRSYLGYLWSILNPLLLMLVLTAVFSQMFKRDIPNFPAYLISGQVLFNFMNDSTKEAMNSIVNNAALLKKSYVPRYIFTVSRVTSTMITLLLSFIALALVFAVTGVLITSVVVFVVVPIFELYIFCIGLGLFLAQAAVFFRDIQYIYSVITTAWMYLTPIFYNIEILPDWLAPFVMYCNPMYSYLMQFRCVTLYNKLPSLQICLAGIIYAFAALIIGGWSFLKTKNNFILYI